MNQTPQKFRRFGIIIIGILGLLGFVTQRNYFSERLQLRTQFANVAGLRSGAEVLMSGFSVGHVVAIHPSDESMRRFEVSIRFDQHYLIPNDSQIALYQSHPLDIVKLDIILGQAKALFQSGDLIPSAPVSPGLLNTTLQVEFKANAVLEKLDTLAQETTKVIVNVNQLLVGPDPQGKGATMRSVLGQTHASLKQADTMLKTLDGEIKRSNLSRLSSETYNTLQTSRANLEQLQTIGEHVDTLLGQISALISRNNDGVYHMARDGEFILRNLATNVTSLIENIQTLTINLSELAQRMRDHPDALLFGRRPHDEPGTTSSKQ